MISIKHAIIISLSISLSPLTSSGSSNNQKKVRSLLTEQLEQQNARSLLTEQLKRQKVRSLLTERLKQQNVRSLLTEQLKADKQAQRQNQSGESERNLEVPAKAEYQNLMMNFIPDVTYLNLMYAAFDQYLAKHEFLEKQKRVEDWINNNPIIGDLDFIFKFSSEAQIYCP